MQAFDEPYKKTIQDNGKELKLVKEWMGLKMKPKFREIGSQIVFLRSLRSQFSLQTSKRRGHKIRKFTSCTHVGKKAHLVGVS